MTIKRAHNKKGECLRKQCSLLCCSDVGWVEVVGLCNPRRLWHVCAAAEIHQGLGERKKEREGERRKKKQEKKKKRAANKSRVATHTDFGVYSCARSGCQREQLTVMGRFGLFDFVFFVGVRLALVLLEEWIATIGAAEKETGQPLSLPCLKLGGATFRLDSGGSSSPPLAGRLQTRVLPGGEAWCGAWEAMNLWLGR